MTERKRFPRTESWVRHEMLKLLIHTFFLSSFLYHGKERRKPRNSSYERFATFDFISKAHLTVNIYLYSFICICYWIQMQKNSMKWMIWWWWGGDEERERSPPLLNRVIQMVMISSSKLTLAIFSWGISYTKIFPLSPTFSFIEWCH